MKGAVGIHHTGVNVTLYTKAKMQHIFPVYAGFMPEADQAIAMIDA